MVDIDVEVDEDVAKPHPTFQSFHEIGLDQPFLSEHLDGIPIAGRLSIALIGDHVVRNVENALAGELEVSFSQVMESRLPDELFAAGAPEGAQLSEIAFQRV